MTHQRLLDPSHGPRDGFPFQDPLTGFTSRGKSLAALFANARAHRAANALPIPNDFDAQIESDLCRHGFGDCVNRDGTAPDLSCVHRGTEVRREGCDTCGGNVFAIIRACAIHGESAMFNRDLGSKVMLCGKCPDRKPLTNAD